MPKYKNNLKFYREKYGYSQEEVANRIGTGKATISKYERGDRKINSIYLLKLAKLFNVTPEVLIGEEVTQKISIKNKEDLKQDMMAFYGSEDISEKDKEEIFNTLQEFYFLQKLKSKK